MQLTDGQLADFERDGYLFLPELFSAEEIAVLMGDMPRIWGMQRPEVLRADDGEVRACLAMERYSEPFRRLLSHPRLLEPALQILDGPVYAHQYKVIPKEPFGKLDFPWHQDFASWHAHDGMPEPRAMNFALFMDEVTEFNGPICFIPGSHRDGRMDAAAEPLPGSTPLLTLSPEDVSRLAGTNGIVAPKGPAGSGVFFHGCLAHASAPNISPWTRHIVYLTCNRVDNAIAKPTRPDYYANQDFTPLALLGDDCLLELARETDAAE